MDGYKAKAEMAEKELRRVTTIYQEKMENKDTQHYIRGSRLLSTTNPEYGAAAAVAAAAEMAQQVRSLSAAAAAAAVKDILAALAEEALAGQVKTGRMAASLLPEPVALQIQVLMAMAAMAGPQGTQDSPEEMRSAGAKEAPVAQPAQP